MKNQPLYEIFAKTLHGLEDILSHELHEIGISQTIKHIRGVSFYGNNIDLFKANFFVRTAICFLKKLFSFDLTNNEELYNGIVAFEWENVFGVEKTFAVEATVNSKYFNHSQFVALKGKDAIADRFRKVVNRRPDVNVQNPDILINIHINNDKCTVSLNSSGEPLFKRGYRIDQYKAPLNETLAAGMILLSNWDKNELFIDPMCGSGTLLIEAAMISLNIPAGFYRKKYAFQNWNDYNDSEFKNICSNNTRVNNRNLKILGSDISKNALDAALKNIRNADLNEYIKLQHKDFLKSGNHQKNGILIFNPPYGKRIESNDIIELYKNIGNQLKRNFAGCSAWIISSNKEAMKFIGLKPEKKYILFNGPLECSFNKYSIFSGSLKDLKSVNTNKE